jgi:hypothetical protein
MTTLQAVAFGVMLCLTPSIVFLAILLLRRKDEEDEARISRPPFGFHWHIIADGKTLKSGTTATEFEARTMADAALKDTEKETGPR